MKLTQILAALPNLTQAELATVWAAIDQLATAQEHISDETSPLYDALCRTLNTRLPYRDFCNSSAYKAWRKNAPAVIEFLDTTWPETNKVSRMALLLLLVEGLRDYLKQREVPITIGTMTTNLPSIPETFDLSYPGYRESGMANIILQAVTRGRK